MHGHDRCYSPLFGGAHERHGLRNGQATTQTTISKLAAQVGAMLDDYDSQLLAMTVEEEIAFGLENQGVAPVKIDQAVTAALEGPYAAYRQRP